MAGGWYFSRAEIENNSPSRKDGIDLKRESQLRFFYCSFIHDLGMKLRVSQLTIATAMMFCHRFYLYQSHAKNDWHTVATVCMFLASKVEDEPVPLDKVTIVAYELIYRRDPAAPQRIRQKNAFEKQRALISIGERLLLTTIRFNLNVEHPYKSLVRALNKFGISQNGVGQLAWNFVNDWLRNILCLQYKPHYIAAGSLYLSAKMHNAKLPCGKGYVWWHEFDVTPHQLNTVIEEMKKLLGYKKNNVVDLAVEKPTQTSLAESKEESVSPDSCLLNTPCSSTRSPSDGFSGRSLESISQNFSCRSNPDARYDCEAARAGTKCQAGEANSPESIVDNSEICGRASESAKLEAEKVVNGLCMVDIERISALRKKRKCESKVVESKVARESSSADDWNLWIEQELESGIELSAQPILKRQRLP